MVADIWTLDMNVGNGRFGGLVVSVPATRSHIPGSNLGTGGGAFSVPTVWWSEGWQILL